MLVGASCAGSIWLDQFDRSLTDGIRLVILAGQDGMYS